MFTDLAAATYASSTGITPEHITAFTRMLTDTFIGAILYFADVNAPKIIAWVMILLVLLIVFRVFKIYKFTF